MSEDLPPSPFLHGVCDRRIAELKRENKEVRQELMAHACMNDAITSKVAELERENAALRTYAFKDGTTITIGARETSSVHTEWKRKPIIAQDANETEGA